MSLFVYMRPDCNDKEMQTSNDIYRLTELKHQLLEAKKNIQNILKGHHGRVNKRYTI